MESTKVVSAPKIEIPVRKQRYCEVCGAKLNINSNSPLCIKHQDIVKTVMWALEHIKVKGEPEIRPSGLVLPK
jgi:hypothetical protein